MVGWLNPEMKSSVIVASKGMAWVEKISPPYSSLVLKVMPAGEDAAELFVVCVGCIQIPSAISFSYEELHCYRENADLLLLKDLNGSVIASGHAVQIFDDQTLMRWLGFGPMDYSDVYHFKKTSSLELPQQFDFHRTLNVLRGLPNAIQSLIGSEEYLDFPATRNKVTTLLSHLSHFESVNWYFIRFALGNDSIMLIENRATSPNARQGYIEVLLTGFAKLRTFTVDSIEKARWSDAELNRIVYADYGTPLELTLQQFISAWAAYGYDQICCLSKILAECHCRLSGPASPQIDCCSDETA